MNRLLALKHKNNESLLSNASSAHDGYETANDDTMGADSTAASMYFSMNESGMQLADKTLEAGNGDRHEAMDIGAEQPASSMDALRVLMPNLTSNCLTPAVPEAGKPPRKSLTSTPLRRRSALVTGGILDDCTQSPKPEVFDTVRKVSVAPPVAADDDDENTENMSVCESEPSVVARADRSRTVQEDAQSSMQSSSLNDSVVTMVETMPAPAPADKLPAESAGADQMEVTSSAERTDEMNEAAVAAAAFAEEVNKAHEIHAGLSEVFRQAAAMRRRTTTRAGLEQLSTIGESGTDSATSITAQCSTSTVASETAPPPRRLTRRSLAIVSPAVRASPARVRVAASTRPSLVPRMTPRKAAAAAAAATARRSIAAGISTASSSTTASVIGARNRRSVAVAASPMRVMTARSRRSVASAASSALAPPAVGATSRARKSILPVPASASASATNAAASAASTSTRASARRSVAAAPATTAKAATPRKVIAKSAAAVLAQNPTRRRASLKPATPVRRMSTLAAVQPKPRTPLRAKTTPQKPVAAAAAASRLPTAAAATRRRSVMPPPSAVGAANNYFACPSCDKTFLQQSRLTQHQRTHEAATPQAPTCAHCHKAFDKPLALRNHLLDHCAKIGVAERRRLLQQRDRDDEAAATSGSYAQTVPQTSSSGGSGLPVTRKRATTAAGAATGASASATSSASSTRATKMRINSPSRAHRGVTHTPNKQIKCTVCSKQFGDPVSYALHVQTHNA